MSFIKIQVGVHILYFLFKINLSFEWNTVIENYKDIAILSLYIFI